VASKPNEIIDFDYLKLEHSDAGFEQLLVIRDRYSGFCDLFPTSTPSAAHTADSLLTYFSYHGVVHTWVSDQGSLFLNQVIQELSILLHCRHYFHVANCPWTHASIENCNRQILNVFRSLCSELHLTRQ
jgi:IS30 family transposase